MAEVATAWVTLAPSMKGFGAKVTSQVGSEVDGAGKSLGSRFGGAIGSAAKVGLAIGAAALVGFAASSIGAASDAQQSIGATETVFGKFANTVVNSSNDAAQAYGLSANTYRENANLIGSLFKNQGVATDELAGKTEQMIGIGADLAATFGGTTTEAVETLGAAFKGEYDSIERYGISLKESTVQAELAKRGQDNLTGAQLAAAKQAVVTDLIMRQSKDSLGAFGRESNTLAGQQQRLGASFENIKATLGAALLPLLTRFAGYLNATVLPAVVGFIAQIQSGTGAGGQFASVVKTIATALASIVQFIVANIDVLGPLAVVVGTVVAALKIWRTVQIALNFVLLANPIGLVIAAVAALVVGLVMAYKKSETFRNIVDTLWATLKRVWEILMDNKQAFLALLGPVGLVTAAVITAYKKSETFRGIVDGLIGALKATATWVVNVAGKLIGALVGAITSVIGKVQSMAGWVRDKASAAWEALKDKAVSAARAILDPVQSVIAKVGDMVAFVRDKAIGIWDTLKSNAVGAFNAIAGPIQTVIDKIQAAIGWVQDLINKIQSIPGVPGGSAKANGTLVGGMPRTAGGVGTPKSVVPQSFVGSDSSVLTELRALRAAVYTVAPGVGQALNNTAANAARSA